MSRRNQTIINEEVTFAETEELVSTTDLRGVITYANDIFCKVAGYTQEELVGKNHNMVRHPDMPKAAFKDLWDALKAGKNWRGAVKNRCKDGRYYWVDAFVTPIFENGQLVGYQSVRVKLEDRYKKAAEAAYKAINQGKNIEPWYAKQSNKHIAFGLTSAAAIGASIAVSPWVSLALVAIPFVCYYDELIATPNFLNEKKKETDSASRWVFSGTQAHSIADFHIKLEKARIRTVLGRVIDASNVMKQGVDTLSQAAHTTKQGVELEASELQQVSAAVEEMVMTINEVADNTVMTSDKVAEAHADCKEATKSMEQTMKMVNVLAEEVSSSSTSANELAQEAEKIGSIMVEIQGIADQTNLLALNAAIEAARAGEHGRGFSVVADEVRALSSRTHGATEQIYKSINEIQSTLLDWSKKMAQGKESALACVEDTKLTQETVMKVYNAISDIADLAMQISTAAEEQGATSQEISRNIVNISQHSDNNLSQANVVEEEANDIRRRTNDMAALGLSFK
ncbi:MAG: PAS domain-containing methyl-accepting chemotaxis protein [Gammaproteobacteria bacterium]|nr:PAS domain-containing methyl-accepting chemotaxis protein [Gammaproteobacteria bacterium]